MFLFYLNIRLLHNLYINMLLEDRLFNKNTQPSVSTIGNFLTIASRFAIRWTPSANVTVTTIGKPSGIAATAKLKNKITFLHWSFNFLYFFSIKIYEYIKTLNLSYIWYFPLGIEKISDPIVRHRKLFSQWLPSSRHSVICIN